MTNEQTRSKGRKPTYRLFNVTGEGKEANWTPIGAAWNHQNSDGFSIQLDVVPLSGRIVMRAVTERTGEAGGQQ